MSSRPGKAGIAFFSLLAIIATTVDTAHAGDCTPSIYGVSYDGKSDPPRFYSIDITNGFGTLIGPTGFNRISAMDVDPTSGILYGVAERPADRQRVLISIDRQTGAGTQIAELTFGDNVEFEHIAGMSFDSSGKLYGYGSWDQGFYTIDVSTGTIVRLGLNALDMYGNGIAFSPGGILYHVGNDNLNTVDLTSGLPTLVAPLLFNLIVDFYGISAMDYAPETGFYYAILKDGQGGATDLVTIDVTTSIINLVGPTADNMDGMAYYCEPVVISDVVFEDGFESQ
jgi:hypothetical protein